MYSGYERLVRIDEGGRILLQAFLLSLEKQINHLKRDIITIKLEDTGTGTGTIKFPVPVPLKQKIGQEIKECKKMSSGTIPDPGGNKAPDPQHCSGCCGT
jgi:hypothetical protein